jgi:hypothetical protein
MKKYLFIITIFSLLVGTTAYARTDFVQWKYVKDVVLTQQSVGGYVKANLDKEISFSAKSDLSDLRIVSRSGEEIPYQLVTLSEHVRNDAIQSVIHDLSTHNGSTMFIVDLGEAGLLHDHLAITTDSRNFKHKVSVFAADSALPVGDAKWRLLTDKGYIYNFYDPTSGFNSGSGEVYYPQNTSRYLRVVISGGDGDLVTVSSVRIFRLLHTASEENQLHVDAGVKLNTERKTTEISVDLGGVGIPTHRIVLTTQDKRNFSRQAIVESSIDGVRWIQVGGGYVFSLDTPLFTGSQLELPFTETKDRYLRVIVMNQDDAPVVWGSAVRIDSTVRGVVFATQPGDSYKLYYGNATATLPTYDLSRYFQYIESTGLVSAQLSPAIQNPDYVVAQPKVAQSSDNASVVLNSILVILVAMITFLLIAYLKKLKRTERGPQ